MKANSDKSKQSNKATRRVLAGVLCGASVLSLVLSLVMPPISQAVANDAQTVSAEEPAADEGSLGEDAGADNDADKGAEEQNSDDAEHGEGEGLDAADPSADGAEAKGAAQPSGDETDDGDGIAPVAEDETKYDIHSGEELVSKLKDKNFRNEKGAATFKLVADIDCNEEVKLEQNNENLIDVVLDLNGHKIKHTSADKPLFDVANGAALTIKDSGRASETVSECQLPADRGQSLNADNYGKKAELTYDTDGIPSELTYYVTDSSPNGTGTTEKLVKHSVEIKGAIVACGGSNRLKLINIYSGGNFNLESGVLTQKKDCSVRNLVYAENGSTVNMNGGYVCGGHCPDNAAGAGISVNNSTFSISNGVIAGNRAPSGGGVYANGSAVTVAGGVISGNSTLDGINGFGGGIMAEGGSVTVSGGYITNNCYAKFCGQEGNGDHGGAGLAAKNGAHVTISGGQITGNYSEEAGGGVYITDVDRNNQSSRSEMAWLNITGGIIASNVSNRSEGAGIRVGQMVDAMINGTTSKKVYISNNHCMSRYDWGGGGIFVQGNSDQGKEYTAGRLFIYNSYISANTAGGYGGGVAVCPTGKTLVTNTEGTAIFGNKDAGASTSYDENDNNGTPHLSEGGHGKNQDFAAYSSKVFRENGHADFFLAATGHKEPIAAVIGKMLGDGDAKYSGSKELNDVIDRIPANGGVRICNSIGLTSGVRAEDDAATSARNAATTFITGNYSWDHGGGIMSNGDLYLGVPADTYVYPSLKLKATKALIDSQTNKNKTLTGNEFSFTVYRKDSGNPIASRAFSPDACTEVGTANNDASGNITFDLGEQFAANGTTGTITYYLVENAGNDHNITYDSAVYEIVVTVEDHTTVLMSVPTRDDPTMTKQLTVHNYTIKNVSATKHSGDLTNSLDDLHADGQGYYSIANSDGSKTFTNVYTPYDSTGSWIPKATKVVKGGEMKEFTLEFATNKDFSENVQSESTQAGGDKSQTLCFSEIKYELKDLDKLASDSTGRGANKTFTYYVREQQPSALFTNYKYDKSVYQITVKATDDSNGKINISATYKQIQDRDGNEVTNGTNYDLTDASTPTFTNTYSTSLPLSGMSGVTLTYLAGAAVLCAAAAWMYIRRKANAKGGERRE
ncbi:MAG: FctA domain-containing protein [Collinsella sp.]|nr:FctA domain-containing protein [Collinsella sp.]